MPNRKPFSTLREQMTPEQREESARKKRALLTAMFLQQVRQAAGLTQKEMADRLGIKQPTLSKMENQDGGTVDTLNRVIEAAGGTLEVIAHLPNGDVKLSQLDPSTS